MTAPIEHEVKNCGSCSMCGLCVHSEYRVCLHPDNKVDYHWSKLHCGVDPMVGSDEGFPVLCPLRKAPLLLKVVT